MLLELEYIFKTTRRNRFFHKINYRLFIGGYMQYILDSDLELVEGGYAPIVVGLLVVYMWLATATPTYGGEPSSRSYSGCGG